jgi:cell division protein FtsW (lipid II flippase)
MSIRKQPKRGAKLVYIVFAIVMFSLVTAKMNCNIVFTIVIFSLIILMLYAVSIATNPLLRNAYELKSIFPASKEDYQTTLSDSVQGLYFDNKIRSANCFASVSNDYIILCIEWGIQRILSKRSFSSITLKIPLEKIRLLDANIEPSFFRRIFMRSPVYAKKHNKYSIDDYLPYILLPSDITSVYPNFPDNAKDEDGEEFNASNSL